jgi:hypothetical protein
MVEAAVEFGEFTIKTVSTQDPRTQEAVGYGG